MSHHLHNLESLEPTAAAVTGTRPSFTRGSQTRYIGLDVHSETIAIAVAEPDGTLHAIGTINNTPEAVRKLMQKLGRPEQLAVCYEAGPTGYVVYWQLVALGIHCDVIAPGLVRPSDRVKTDRRDALKLARSYRNGDLTPIWVPDAAHEALCDLVRAREDALADRLRSRSRLTKLLLRHGLRRPIGMNPWGPKHRQWLQRLVVHEQVFQVSPALHATLVETLYEIDHQAERLARLDTAIVAAVPRAPAPLRALIGGLQTLRGVAFLTATTLAAELGTLMRFQHPKQLMGYIGLVPSEHSSGQAILRGRITKSGNAHVRRVLVEAAWSYRHAPHLTDATRRRGVSQSDAVQAIAWRAQHRLYTRFRRLSAKGKPHPKIIAAIARELLGFMWAIAHEVESPTLGMATPLPVCGD